MSDKIVCFGEIMLRLSPSNFQRLEQAKTLQMDFGGSESNVAGALAQLGVQVDYVTRLPDHPISQSALNSLNLYGVNTSKSIRGGERLGIYYVEQGSGRRSTKVIYDRTNSGMYSLEKGMILWEKIFDGATWFHWSGITPSLSAKAASATLEAIQAAHKAGLVISCDLNYRSKLWQYGTKPIDIMPDLIAYTHVMMGDTDVMDVYFGIEVKNQTDACEKLIARFPSIQYIGMTNREGISASQNTYQGFLYHQKKIYESKYYELPDMIDRIGTGDAYMAGLIYQLMLYKKNKTTLDHAVDFATACAVHKHYIPGDYNYFTMDDLTSLMKGGTGGKVKR